MQTRLCMFLYVYMFKSQVFMNRHVKKKKNSQKVYCIIVYCSPKVIWKEILSLIIMAVFKLRALQLYFAAK